ncbi:hypothetical protein ACFWPK_34060 [Nocardia sp. NPDC058519]
MDPINSLDLYRTDAESAEFMLLFDLGHAIQELAEHGLLTITDDQAQGA